MAYTVLPTVATGDTLTAAQWNLWVKDNFATLFPYTTAGDMAFASSPTTLSRLAAVAGKYIRFNLAGNAPEAVDLPVATIPAVVKKRQGGHATNWNTAGTTNYTLTSADQKIQSGSANAVFPGGSQLATVTITFPEAFGDVPEVFVSGGTFWRVATRWNPTATTVDLKSYDILSSPAGGSVELVHWWAVGKP